MEVSRKFPFKGSNSPGADVHSCNPSYLGDADWRISAQIQPRKIIGKTPSQ
jgi:hypothetical protein